MTEDYGEKAFSLAEHLVTVANKRGENPLAGEIRKAPVNLDDLRYAMKILMRDCSARERFELIIELNRRNAARAPELQPKTEPKSWFGSLVLRFVSKD